MNSTDPTGYELTRDSTAVTANKLAARLDELADRIEAGIVADPDGAATRAEATVAAYWEANPRTSEDAYRATETDINILRAAQLLRYPEVTRAADTGMTRPAHEAGAADADTREVDTQ